MTFFKKSLLTIVFSALSLGFVNQSRADFVNVQFQPIMLVLGVVALQVDFAVVEGLTLGGKFSNGGFSIADFGVHVESVGVRANYFFRGADLPGGFYVGASVEDSRVTVKEDTVGQDIEGTADFTMTQILAGYQWMWSSFNMKVAGGLSNSDIDKIELKDSSGNVQDTNKGYSGNGVAFEFALGWKF